MLQPSWAGRTGSGTWWCKKAVIEIQEQLISDLREVFQKNGNSNLVNELAIKTEDLCQELKKREGENGKNIKCTDKDDENTFYQIEEVNNSRLISIISQLRHNYDFADPKGRDFSFSTPAQTEEVSEETSNPFGPHIMTTNKTCALIGEERMSDLSLKTIREVKQILIHEASHLWGFEDFLSRKFSADLILYILDKSNIISTQRSLSFSGWVGSLNPQGQRGGNCKSADITLYEGNTGLEEDSNSPTNHLTGFLQCECSSLTKADTSYLTIYNSKLPDTSNKLIELEFVSNDTCNELRNQLKSGRYQNRLINLQYNNGYAVEFFPLPKN